MSYGRAGVLAAAVLTLGGCALRSDVNRLELQLAQARVERSRADSVNAANLAAIARLVQSLYDTLASQADMVTRLRGDTRTELYNIEQQLVAIQELTGQSQQRLSELRTQMDDRFQALTNAAPAAPPSAAAPNPAGVTPPSGAPAPAPGAPVTGQALPSASPAPAQPPAAAPDPSADQLLDLSLTQLRRGSPATARVGLAEFLRRFPANPRAVDAEFFTGEAWAAEHNSDSAAAAYQRVVQRYATAPRAAAAMYKLGLIAAQAGRREEARSWFNRVVTAFPNSEEAALARDQLRAPPQNPPAARPQARPASPRP